MRVSGIAIRLRALHVMPARRQPCGVCSRGLVLLPSGREYALCACRAGNFLVLKTAADHGQTDWLVGGRWF